MSSHTRIIAPRRMWASMAEAARDLGCNPTALYAYVEWRGASWYLKPLDEGAYARWHRRVWAGREKKAGGRPCAPRPACAICGQPVKERQNRYCSRACAGKDHAARLRGRAPTARQAARAGELARTTSLSGRAIIAIVGSSSPVVYAAIREARKPS